MSELVNELRGRASWHEEDGRNNTAALLREAAARIVDAERETRDLRVELLALMKWREQITVGALDAFNAPASRIHRALGFARQHGYHETDEAFAELHGLRERIDALERRGASK